jgi:hypothetical protein
MSCHHTYVNFKFQPVKGKDGTETPPVSLSTGHTLPCYGHPSQGHGTKHSTRTWYNYALAKPTSILVLSYKKHFVFVLNYYKMWVQFITPHSLDQ